MDSQRRRHLDQGPPLDSNLAERYLSGALAPDDLPPALGPMASVVEALRSDSMHMDSMHTDAMHRVESEQRTIDSMVSLLSYAAEHPVRRLRLRLRTPVFPRPLGGFRVRLATSVVAVALAFMLGAAYGRLPAPAQNAASVVLSKVGLDIPRHHSGKHAVQLPGDSGDQSGESEDQGGAVGPDPNGPAHDGLCNAYLHGDGGVEGGKYDSVAFQNLQKAAADAGQTVEEFCGVGSGSEEGADQHGKSQEEHGQGNEHSQHGSGDQGQDEQGSDDQGQDEQSGDQGQDEQGSDQGSPSDHGDSGDHGHGSHGTGSDDSQGSAPSN